MRRGRYARLLFTLVFFSSAAAGTKADTSSPPELRDRVAAAVERLASTAVGDGTPLLPPGTALESVTVSESKVADVRLRLAAGVSMPRLSETSASDIDSALHAAVAPLLDLAGLSVQLCGADGACSLLAALVPEPAPLPPDPDSAADQKAPARAALRSGEEPLAALGGPVANADGQPAGALSGVVVFCAAGHGWTVNNGGTGWVLQRPLLLDMNEDYGNIDQLNYFVHYLYNAGATVVPFRPVGYQSTEIVLDNDDPGVTYTGSWTNSTTAAEWYENGVTNSGVRYRFTTSNATETATARYTPNIPAAGFYPVYCWTRDNTDRVLQAYRIRHSGGTAVVRVNHQVVGKGWIWLGNYHFEAGTGGYVEISNQATTVSTVVADAIRFGNGMGDVVGAGSAGISGYPRDEEASRYWAESEAGINADGLSSSIWNCCETDIDDNVGTAARWARAMNRTDVNNDRWRRIYMEFHTNAAGGTGTVALWNDPGSDTTNQLKYATVVGEKVEADLVALVDQLEYPWGIRNPNTYNGTINYGAINDSNNGNEFDATILEVAFHDNAVDAANLRNAKVRDAVARATVNGIIEFLSDGATFPGTQVPDVFAPDAPERVQVRASGSDVIVSWQAGPSRPSSPASGDPATSYKIYRSSNGYGFGNAVNVGNVLTATLSDVPADSTVYIRVAAVNAGGESMPSETLAVRRSPEPARILIVNGYDRVSRQQNFIQPIPQGPMERPIPRYVNSFDYIVQHASALEPTGLTFDSCSNEAVISGAVNPGVYDALIWILGRESQADETFSLEEQSLVTTYLNQGGRLFVTGTDIGYELDGLDAGRAFFESVLNANYIADDAGSFTAIGVGGCLAGLGSFSFSTSAGAPYRAVFPDRLSPQPAATAILNYQGGSGGVAGIEYVSGLYRVVMFGFPFETIGSASVRADVMDRVMTFLLDGIRSCQTAQLTRFEGYAAGTQVMFQLPRFSGSTLGDLLAAPNVAEVSGDVPAFDGTGTLKVQWQWVDADPSRWLRLTTASAANVPNPVIDLRRPVRIRLRLDSGSLRVALGIREVETEAEIGANGGTSGTIEWIGATSVVDEAPQGVLVTAQPGVWQTVAFLPSAAALAFTGDGVLQTSNGKGVFEHLAFASNGEPGPLTVYLDGIEQPCPPLADFDLDGDVDQEDFGHLQACMTGPFTAQTDAACMDTLMDNDSDVDAADLEVFRKCLGAPNVVVDPDCAAM